MNKCSNRLIFNTFWLVNCKLMLIRIQLSITRTNADMDPDPAYHFDADTQHHGGTIR
jgi:hypothetical protein